MTHHNIDLDFFAREASSSTDFHSSQIKKERCDSHDYTQKELRAFIETLTETELYLLNISAKRTAYWRRRHLTEVDSKKLIQERCTALETKVKANLKLIKEVERENKILKEGLKSTTTEKHNQLNELLSNKAQILPILQNLKELRDEILSDLPNILGEKKKTEDSNRIPDTSICSNCDNCNLVYSFLKRILNRLDDDIFRTKSCFQNEGPHELGFTCSCPIKTELKIQNNYSCSKHKFHNKRIESQLIKLHKQDSMIQKLSDNLELKSNEIETLKLQISRQNLECNRLRKLIPKQKNPQQNSKEVSKAEWIEVDLSE